MQIADKRFRLLLAGVIAVLSISLFGCEKEQSRKGGDDKTQKLEKQAGVDKLVFAFQPQANPESISPDAEKMADFLSDEIGVDVEVYLPTNYAGVVEALRSENADVAYLGGWPYLVAHKKANAEILVAEQRRDKPFYYSHLFVRSDSDYKKLSDLKGKKMSFVSPTSTSGYLFPVARMVEEGVLEKGGDPKDFFSDIMYAGGYLQSFKALLEGQVDVAAADGYAKRMYLDDKQKKKIRSIAKLGPVPTHLIAIRGGIPDKLKGKVKEALLALNDNSELLKSVYGAQKLIERGHKEHVGALEKALDRIGKGLTAEDIQGEGAGYGSGSGSGSAHGSGQHEKTKKGANKGSGDGSGAGSGAGSGTGK